MKGPLPTLAVLFLVLASGCASLPDNVEKRASAAFSADVQTSLGRLFASDVSANPGQSGVQVIDKGKHALQLRLGLLAMAEQAVDLQYYIWSSDFSGRLVAERALQGADRGVRIRLLLDDFSVGDREKAGEKRNLPSRVAATGMLPANRDYYRYHGSLTTVPSSEGVRWRVRKEPLTASKAQIEKFAHIMHQPNNRPVQAVNSRPVLR